MSHQNPFKTFCPIFSSVEMEEKALNQEIATNYEDFGIAGSAKKPDVADSEKGQSIVIEGLCREIISIEPGGLLDQYS